MPFALSAGAKRRSRRVWNRANADVLTSRSFAPLRSTRTNSILRQVLYSFSTIISGGCHGTQDQQKIQIREIQVRKDQAQNQIQEGAPRAADSRGLSQHHAVS